MQSDIIHTGCLSICSNRFLFGEDVIEPLEKVTRTLVHALATQWVGINIIPREYEDTWIIVGIAYFMTDTFLKRLSGNNEYRFQQKRASDRVVELDVHRPSLRDLGSLLDLDPAEHELLNLKAPLVLFILDQRLKKSGDKSVARIITKIFFLNTVGEIPGAAISHSWFVRQCEKITHTQLQSFFEQWTDGIGCPKFQVTQRFNKKKLVVEMSINQVQAENLPQKELIPDTFMRDIKEDKRQVDSGSIQAVFTVSLHLRFPPLWLLKYEGSDDNTYT